MMTTHTVKIPQGIMQLPRICRPSGERAPIAERFHRVAVHDCLRPVGRHVHHLGLLLALLASVGLTGCSEHSAEGEEHHLEHLIPAHKPAGFAEGVAELRLRLGRYADGSLTEAGVDELRDIVEWLPELAGDSDLRRPQWEQAQRVQRELERLLAETSPGEMATRTGPLLDELDQLVPHAGPSPSRVTHHHHHHHDDHDHDHE